VATETAAGGAGPGGEAGVVVQGLEAAEAVVRAGVVVAAVADWAVPRKR
jgi:hypothetical protein